ncbi:dCTP deaminase [Nonomuraea sp. NPDC003754]
MILTGAEIARQHKQGRIMIDPFTPDQVNPNSYNFRLGPTIKTYTGQVLDVARPNPARELTIGEDGLVLQPDRIYLGHTLEVMGSDHYVPIIRARSSIARLGLFVHVTADLIDIGSHNQWTLQLHAVQPVRVYPGLPIGQVTFWQVRCDITLYDGKYQGARGPRESEIYRDFPRPAAARSTARRSRRVSAVAGRDPSLECADPASRRVVAAAFALIASRYVLARHQIGAAILDADGRLHLGLHLDAMVGRAAVCAEAVALGTARMATSAPLILVAAVRHPNQTGRAEPGPAGASLRAVPRTTAGPRP